MEIVLKGAINRCSNLTFIFEILKLSITILLETERPRVRASPASLRCGP